MQYFRSAITCGLVFSVSIGCAFTTIGSKWDMGPNSATFLAGHEGTPGMVTWSIMGPGLAIVTASDTHEGALTGSFGSLLGGPGASEEAGLISGVMATWASECDLTIIPVGDGGAPGGGPESAGGHLGDMRFASLGVFPSGILAHAFEPGTEGLFGPGATIRGDVHMNSSLTWVDDAHDPDDGHHYDLFTVMLHEVGHALGLGHSTVPGSVMGPEYTGGHRALSEDDIAGIRFIYGPKAVPEPTTMVALGSGLLLLFRRRKRAR